MSLANAFSPDQASATILRFRPRPPAEPRAAQFDRIIAAVERTGLVIQVVDGLNGYVAVSFAHPPVPGFWPSRSDNLAAMALSQLFQDSPIFRELIETRCAWLGTNLRRPAETKSAISSFSEPPPA